MSVPSVRITYNLHPPAATQAPEGLSSNETHDFPVVREEESSLVSRSYYAALHQALGEAKEVLGKELTAWRDAAGGLEKDKEAGKHQDEDEDEDEIDEDDEIDETAGKEDTTT